MLSHFKFAERFKRFRISHQLVLVLIFIFWALPRLAQVDTPIEVVKGRFLKFPYPVHVSPDSNSYLGYARALNLGNWSLHPYRAPGYPAFIAVSSNFLGLDPRFAAVAAGMAVTLFGAIVLYKLCMALHLSVLTSAAVAIAYVGNYHLVSHELFPLLDVFLANVVIIALYLFVKNFNSSSWSSTLVDAGAWIFLVFTKYMFAFFVPFYLIRYFSRQRSDPLKKRIQKASLFCLICAVTAFAIAKRHEIDHGYFGLSTQGAAHLTHKIIQYRAFERLPEKLETAEVRQLLNEYLQKVDGLEAIDGLECVRAGHNLNDLLLKKQYVEGLTGLEKVMKKTILLNLPTFVKNYLIHLTEAWPQTNDYLTYIPFKKLDKSWLKGSFVTINKLYVDVSSLTVSIFVGLLLFAVFLVFYSKRKGKDWITILYFFVHPVTFITLFCLLFLMLCVVGTYNAYARLKIPADPILLVLSALIVERTLGFVGSKRQVLVQLFTAGNRPSSEKADPT